MTRRTLVRAVIILVLAVLVLSTVADRLTESAAAHALSVKARQTGLLADDPSVSINGFPFLTQSLHRRYTQIDVTTHGIHRGGLRLDTVTGRFRGVHVGLGAVLAGTVGAVPIDHATGEVDLTYADLDAFLRSRRVTVATTGAGTSVRVSGTVTMAGKPVAVGGPGTLGVSGDTVTLAPTASRLRGPGGLLSTALAKRVAATFTVRLTLNDLPFGLRLQTVTATTAGLTVAGAARGLTVEVPSDAAHPGSG